MGLRSKYAHEFDDGNWGAFGALFTDDGILDYNDREQLEGPDEIEQFGETEVRYDLTLHTAHMPDITVDGDRAEGTWYLLVFYVLGSSRGWVVGEYTDLYRRVDGKWKFSYITNENYFDTGDVHETTFG